MNMTSPIIQDAAVRKAIAKGIDKQALSPRCWIVTAFPATVRSRTGLKTFGGENVTTETYDPEGAKAVPNPAGWTDHGDGIREKGRREANRLADLPQPSGTAAAGRIRQATLKDIGIDADINCNSERQRVR